MTTKLVNVAFYMLCSFILASCATNRPGATQASNSGGPIFAPGDFDPALASLVPGIWRTNFGPTRFEPVPGKKSVFRGAWLYEKNGRDVVGTFSGRLNADVMLLRWKESGLVGSAELRFSAKDQSFSGHWWTDSRDRSGDWSGARAALGNDSVPL